jgi:cytochrome oxidase assembly protein ShyY1
MTLLIFWNLPSAACEAALLEIKRLARRADPKKLDIIHVFSKQSAKVVQYLRWKKMQFTCVYDHDEELFESYRIQEEEMPTFYVIDDACNLLERWIGYDEETLQEMRKLVWKYRKRE